jgi:precorrin-4 methylase
MSRFSERRTLTVDELRALCIKRNWYTEGDNAEYDHLLSLVEDRNGYPVHLTTEKLEEIAEDIHKHSDLYDDDCSMIVIMQELGEACTTSFYPIA